MSAAPKFTPGPWIVISHEARNGFDLTWHYSVERVGADVVARGVRDRSDARLIAAAPELFVACDQLLQRFVLMLAEHGGTDSAKDVFAVEAASAALAKVAP